jgi:hypothetical protein
MHVAVEENFSRLQSSFHHELRVVVDGVELGRARHPLTVQIDSHERAPIVTNDNTIWVLHWDNFENKGIPKKLGLLTIAN